jgi:hypothetical protein
MHVTLQRNATGHSSFQVSIKANLTHCPAVHVYMHKRGLWPAKKPLGVMLYMTLSVSELPPFLHFPTLAQKVGFFAKARVLLFHVVMRS